MFHVRGKGSLGWTVAVLSRKQRCFSSFRWGLGVEWRGGGGGGSDLGFTRREGPAAAATTCNVLIVLARRGVLPAMRVSAIPRKAEVEAISSLYEEYSGTVSDSTEAAMLMTSAQ